MSRSYRKKPLAQYEFGTRIHAPTTNEARYRIVGFDAATGKRVFASANSEAAARRRARELDALADPANAPVPLDARPRTVAELATRYKAEHLAALSVRYREKHTYLLTRWILPHLADITVTDWTPVDSARVLTAARTAGLADATIQDIGSALRALVTHARRLRWLTQADEDPMWMVRYHATATIQGTAAVYVARDSLPTDQQCNDLFNTMTDLGYARWATAMRLAHRSGLRWGELTALQAGDIEFEPARVIHVRRAVEQPVNGPATLKRPKNGKTRTTIFPRSHTDPLRALVAETSETAGRDGLLFPGRSGQIVRRSAFQQIWIRSAAEADWPMRTPLRRTNGYGQNGKGWRWTGAAKWTPHDLRHVAACWMLFDLGLDPAIVADKLGHADPAFTMRRYIGIRGNPDLTATHATENW